MKNSMRKAIEIFLSRLNENTVSIQTLDYYRNELFLLLQLMEQVGKLEWGELSYTEVNAYFQEEKNMGKILTVSKKRHIQDFFLFMYEYGFIDKTIIRQ